MKDGCNRTALSVVRRTRHRAPKRYYPLIQAPFLREQQSGSLSKVLGDIFRPPVVFPILC